MTAYKLAINSFDTDNNQLVGFIAHPNPQIRVVAAENSVPYSVSDASLFKSEDLKPIKHLKASIQDHPVRINL